MVPFTASAGFRCHVQDEGAMSQAQLDRMTRWLALTQKTHSLQSKDWRGQQLGGSCSCGKSPLRVREMIWEIPGHVQTACNSHWQATLLQTSHNCLWKETHGCFPCPERQSGIGDRRVPISCSPCNSFWPLKGKDVSQKCPPQGDQTIGILQEVS